MPNRTTRTEIIFLGEEIITGKTRKKGMITDPIAKINLVEKNVRRWLENDVDKVAFTVDAKYEEATMKEDVPHFLLEIFGSDNVVIGSKEWFPSKDFYRVYDDYSLTISVVVDVENWRAQTINLRAHLKCWLEESPWFETNTRTTTITASAEDYVNIKLVVPEVREPGPNPPGITFKVFGRALGSNETPKDYQQQYIGKDYEINTFIVNNTYNELMYGQLDVYENGARERDISPSWRRIVPGEVFNYTDTLAKFWTWYDDTSSDGRIHIVDTRNRIFVYKLKYCLTDEYGFLYQDTIDEPLKKLKIVISLPQYKLDAVQTYNWSFSEEETGNWAGLILSLDLCLLAAWIAWPAEGAVGAGGAVGGAATSSGDVWAALGLSISGAITTWYAGKTISELAQDVRTAAKNLIDDPPKFDKNYKQIIKLKIKKLSLPKPKTAHEKIISCIAKLKSSVSSDVEALIITSSRVWSAELKKNKTTTKKQKAALRKFRSKVQRELRQLANKYIILSKLWSKSKIRFNYAAIMAFKQRVKRKGLPKEIKVQLRKRGFSTKRTAEIQKTISNLAVEQLNIVKTYSGYSKSLRKLAKSIGEFT